jgi:hypothetical protein
MSSPKSPTIANPTQANDTVTPGHKNCKYQATTPAAGSFPANLIPKHLEKVREWGFTPATVRRIGCYSETDIVRIRFLLGGSNLDDGAKALVLPGFDRYGNRNGCHTLRMLPEVRWYDGRAIRYLFPSGVPFRPYFPPFECVWQTLAAPPAGTILLWTEGIAKAVAAAQVDIAAVALNGPEAWSAKRLDPTDRTEGRVLLDELAGLPLCDLIHLVLFDTDGKRNPLVHHGGLELVRALREVGAVAGFVRLPVGPIGEDGLPVKQEIDQFIKQQGADHVRHWLALQARRLFARPQVFASTAYRRLLGASHLATRAEEGAFVSVGPTGSGKTFAEIRVLESMGEDDRSTTLNPTHGNNAEFVAMAASLGVAAAADPDLTEANCQNYEVASEARRLTLPLVPTVCLADCPHSDGCPHLLQSLRAEQAQHRVTTHARGAVDMPKITADRKSVTFNEDPTAALNPDIEADGGFYTVAKVCERAAQLAPWKWKKDKLHLYYQRMADIAHELEGWVRGESIVTEPIPLPAPPRHRPENPFPHLFQIVRQEKMTGPGAAFVIVLGLVEGTISELYVHVKEVYRKSKVEVDVKDEEGGSAAGGLETGGEEKDTPAAADPADLPPTEFVRSIVAFKRTPLPSGVRVMLNVAAAQTPALETLLGQALTDITPPGQLKRLHRIVQIPRDVRVGTEASVAAKILRGALYELPYRRIGVITHRHLTKTLPKLLGPDYAARVVKWGYFWGGETRGSNEWMKQCDALIILGTPRPPPSTYRKHLLRFGKLRAARMTLAEAEWVADWWAARTERGKTRVVRTPHYRDHDWHMVYHYVVVTELVQCVGRARADLPEGTPCFLFSTENMAPDPNTVDVRHVYPLADEGRFNPLTEPQARVLSALRDEDGRRVERTSAQVVEVLRARGDKKVSGRRVREVLVELAIARRVRKIGWRKGWVIPPQVHFKAREV